MNGLIIAAGRGRRLSALSSSKPLTPVAGRPLIGHVVDRARQGGVTAFTVVTGHEAERVETFLAGLASTVDIGKARWIDVDSPAMLALAEGFVAQG